MVRKRLICRLMLVLLLLPLMTGASLSGDTRVEDLPRVYQQWLDDVALLITKEERQTFLALEKDYQRDAFIRRFWEARDPYPESRRNDFKEVWYARLEEARKLYGNLTEDRSRVFLRHGPPTSLDKTDCGLLLWPLEIWFYAASDRLPEGYTLVFYQPAAGGRFRLWHPSEGYGVLQALYQHAPDDYADDRNAFVDDLHRYCPVLWEKVRDAVDAVRVQSQLGAFELVEYPPPVRDTEWLETFLTLSTDVPEDAPRLEAQLELGYPEAVGSRTVVQGVLAVPVRPGDAEATLDGTYHYLLTAEVLLGEELFESFRYRFDVPAAETAGGVVPLIFQRYLRPARYRLVYKLEDLQTGALFGEEVAFEVPEIEAPPPEEAVTTALDEAAEDLAAEEPALRLVPPEGETHTGSVRIEARVAGEEVTKVEFFLDGQSLLAKNRPPYSVELLLGSLPTTREVRAVGYDRRGREVASDELLLNAGAQRFMVRLLEPRQGGSYRGTVTARVEVQVPDGEKLARLELYVGDQRVATLYQPPFVQPVTLPPGGEVQFVRAVAYLANGTSAEALSLVNAPDYQENLDVRLVELYASVVDGRGRLVGDLGREDFRVLDGGKEQTVLRFEQVKNLPVHTVLLLDTSASMVEALPQAQRAALGFLRRTLTSRDRAAVVTFSDHPRLAVKLTNDLPTLAGALAGLRAERGTVLYDSVVFALQYMKGIRGQRALLILSDGSDRSSRFSFGETLEFARRSGATIYAVGLGLSKLNLEARRRLGRLAEETGGQSYFVESAEELDGVYGRILDELRSRYLLAYQPNVELAPGEFRPVEVETTHPGLEVVTIRGYYP